MAYEVTARKYRPKTFEEVVGQEHITTTLKNAISTGKIAHAYLLTGPRGVGKTTTARILARSINCLNPKDGEPCNVCDMCQSIQGGQLIDIIEIDAASNRGIDEIRSLRESVRYAPSKGKFKVYIIDEVHMLTKESFNAFLKTLEEPPGHIVFIFATTDINRVPATIISRCQRYDFRRIKLEAIKVLLHKIAEAEEISVDDRTLTLIAKKADGGLRDAESYYDQVVAFCGKNVVYESVTQLLNVVDEELFFQISDAVLQKNFSEAFTISLLIYDRGWNYNDFTDRLIEHFRNILVAVVTRTTEIVETAQIFHERYLSYSGSFSESDLLRIIAYLGKVSQDLKYSLNQKLKVELALSHIIGLEQSLTISELISSIGDGGKSTFQTSTPQASKQSTKSNSASVTPDVQSDSLYNKPAAPDTQFSVKESGTPTPAKQSSLDVKEDWNIYVQAIIQGKSFVFNGFADEVRLKSFDGSDIVIEAGSQDIFLVFKQWKKYFEDKVLEVFKRRFNVEFVLSDNPRGNTEEAQVNSAVEKKSASRAIDPNDPVVKFIKEDLGGEQVQ